jgi:hypothetical protein
MTRTILGPSKKPQSPSTGPAPAPPAPELEDVLVLEAQLDSPPSPPEVPFEPSSLRAPQATPNAVNAPITTDTPFPPKRCPMNGPYHERARPSKLVFAGLCIATALASAGCETRCGDLAHEVCQRACECGGCAIQTQNPVFWSRTPTFELLDRVALTCERRLYR